MNKAELVSKVVASTGISKKDTTTVVDGILNEITSALALGEPVKIQGFGNFEVKERAARKGRNPQSGAEIDISESKVPKFKPAKALKDSVNA